jgi:hypothetical protein
MLTATRIALAGAALPLVLLPFRPILDEPRPDAGKRQVEQPVERALAPDSPPFSRRRVEPGLVRWHTDLQAALAAAEISKKPVLLFQLLGRLDDEFC